ncbi:GNAT family N-acetyltransferase [Kitasatospora sp. NPDC049258]|uniref:GNAT family N-acetyltransferase n=1 Tax=Kitasatospora sp. NPDC049258 TaxID=3155394 RepID=UPI00342F591A
MTSNPQPVRPATPADADELLRLRVAVLAGEAVTDRWRATYREDLRSRLGTDPDLVAYVVPADAGLAACAIGIAYRGYSGPEHPAGRWGRIHTVVTDPAHRRRGHGRAVTTAVIEALRARSCTSIELISTEDGLALYESLGFTRTPTYLALRRPLY